LIAQWFFDVKKIFDGGYKNINKFANYVLKNKPFIKKAERTTVSILLETLSFN